MHDVVMLSVAAPCRVANKKFVSETKKKLDKILDTSQI